MTPQNYITKRLAYLREQLGKPWDPIGRMVIEAKISDLEAVQSHLSQSTHPAVAGTGKYQALKGKSVSYLANGDGFYIAQAFDNLEGHEVLERIASDLNELEALRASHEKTVSLLERHDVSRKAHQELTGHPYYETELSESTSHALTKAQSLINPYKMPTAAPQGQ